MEIIPQVVSTRSDCRYRREDVTVLRTPRGWMQKGRRVMDKETWMKKRSDCSNKNKQHNQANSKKTQETNKKDNNQKQTTIINNKTTNKEQSQQTGDNRKSNDDSNSNRNNKHQHKDIETMCSNKIVWAGDQH